MDTDTALAADADLDRARESSTTSCASRASAPIPRTPATSTRARRGRRRSCATPGSTTCARSWSTAVIPYVVGEWTHAPGAPTVLLYAHHDVQPAGLRRPLDRRPVRAPRARRPPLRPRHRRRQGRRGRAPRRGARLARAPPASCPCNVKVLVEGEEEIGSPGLAALPHRPRRRPARPTCCSSPTPATGRSACPGSPTPCAASPASTCACGRSTGRCTAGWPAASSPIRSSGWRSMLATLVDEHGDPAFDGCWDDYEPPDAAERARLDALPENVDRLRTDWGVRDGVAARRRSVDARCSSGSGCDPRSPSSGSTATRSRDRRTRSWREAAARVSVRVGRGQDPARLNDALRLHFERRVPLGLELTVTPLEEVPAWHTDPTGWAFDAATRALRAGFGVDPVCMGVGGTIPFVGPFADAFGGIPALLLGPADPSQPHPRRGREPPPRRLALAHPQRDPAARRARGELHGRPR